MGGVTWIPEGRMLRVDPPKKPKKITGTRFAAIMGLNTWNTPFKTWCEITRTYTEPFEETIYTRAGRIIEPKQADYMKRAYFMQNLITPTEKYGEDYFRTTRGDFFPEDKIFGGMWDYLLVDENGKPTAVLEMKTTKRSEDWAEDIPPYYALQAALYAYLLGVEDVYMVASFLEDGDYQRPESFIPSAQNTIVVPFKLHERYPNFSEYIDYARSWWENNVEYGISPQYDEVADREVLRELRTLYYSPETDVQAMVKELGELIDTISKYRKILDPLEKRFNALKATLKQSMIDSMGPYDDRAVLRAGSHTLTLFKSTGTKVDREALARDGILDKYTVTDTQYKMTFKED